MRKELKDILFVVCLIILWCMFIVTACPVEAIEFDYTDRVEGLITGDFLEEACNEETFVDSGFCRGYIAGIYDAALDTILITIQQGIIECPNAPDEVTIKDLVAMTKWIFETYPEASKPTTDAEMVVLHAILEYNRCVRPESNLGRILERMEKELGV